jgi:hypothetical protein
MMNTFRYWHAQENKLQLVRLQYKYAQGQLEDSEVAYNDTRGHGQFKATRPESPKEKKKKGVALLP